MTESTHCKCGNEIVNEPRGNRAPCPKCGSTARVFSASGSSIVTVRDGFHTKTYSPTRRPKKPGKSKKPVHEEYNQDELYAAENEQRRVVRVLDHEKDRYAEKITKVSTGEVIKDIEEKLSEHRGHGSKPKKPKP